MRLKTLLQAPPSAIGTVFDLLRTVLSDDGRIALEPIHHAVLDAVALRLFGRTAAPAGSATDLPADLRQEAAELVLIMPLVDPVMDRRKVAVAARLLDRLGMPVVQIDLLRDAAEGRLGRLRLRVANRLVTQLAGIGMLGAIGAVVRTRFGADRGFARRMRDCGTLADGTIGRGLLDYYADNPFPIPGDPGGLPPVLVARHDFLHVLTGYDTSTEGELCLSGFTGSCAGSAARLDPIVVGLLQFNQAMAVQAETKAVVTRGALRPDSYFLALARGAACRVDVADPAWDYAPMMARDLAAARDEIAIGADGVMVTPAQPRWAVAGRDEVLGGQRRRADAR